MGAVIVWLAVVLWLLIVAWSLALMRAAGSAERQVDAPRKREDPPRLPRPLGRHTERIVVAT